MRPQATHSPSQNSIPPPEGCQLLRVLWSLTQGGSCSEIGVMGRQREGAYKAKGEGTQDQGWEGSQVSLTVLFWAQESWVHRLGQGMSWSGALSGEL